MKLSKSEAARLNGRKGGRPRKPRAPATAAAPSVNPPAATQAVAPPTEAPVDNPFDLSPKELLFVEAYCGVANFNATEAYALAGYRRDDGNASKLTVRYRIVQAIAAKLAVKAQRLEIADDDECLRRVTLRSRADIGKIDPESKYAKLPDEIRLAIKTVRPTRYGDVIELYDTHREDKLLLEVSGKLTQRHEIKITRTIEDILEEAHQLHEQRQQERASA